MMRHAASSPIRWTALAAVALLSACAGGPGQLPNAGAPVSEPGGLLGPENGLEVRQWITSERTSALQEALAGAAVADASDEAMHDRLARNGLRLVKIPLERLDELDRVIGDSSMSLRAWHGQVPAWRELYRRAIEPEGRAIAIDGRVRLFQSGEIRLLVRSWTLMMEDGPRLQLEVLPEHHQADSRTVVDLLEARPVRRGTPLPAAVIDLRLEPGYAWLLTSAPSATQASAASTTSEPTVRRLAGPPDGPGPVVQAPTTLGAFLFEADTIPPTCGMLVFVPRIPRELMPGSPAALPPGP